MNQAAAVFGGPVAIIIVVALSLAFLATVGVALYRLGKRRSSVDVKALELLREARGIMSNLVHPTSIDYVSYLTSEDRHDCEEWLAKVTKKGLISS